MVPKQMTLLTALLMGVPLPVWAEPQVEPAPAVVTQAAEWWVSPRFGVDYQTGEGGYRDFGSVNGLVPLGQGPGRDLWFLQGQARVDTAGHLGGNLLVGYRTLTPNQTTLVGGYLGLDVQGSDESTFYQLGAGFERVSQGWELRSNLYLPVGDRTSESSLTGAPFFEGNQLLLPTTREVAMAGGDVTLGGAIAHLNSLGPLKAYGGLYYYGHPDVSGILGGRAWLALDPAEQVNLRLGLHHDGRTGTHLLLQTGFTWGGRPSALPTTAAVSALAGPVQRTLPIWVIRDDQDEVAQNPVTGQDYRFHHVLPAIPGGDGTLASPYGDITGALALAQAGDVVYVQPGNLASGFTIPDGVQVLSTAVEQPLPTQVGSFGLPGSGGGVRPYVPGPVTLGNATRLSGFTLEAGPQQDGVQANAITGVALDNNLILSARNGILLNQVSGDVYISRNQIQTAEQNGILLNLSGQTVGTAAMSQNRVVNAGENGVLVRVADGSQLESLVLHHTQVDAAQENGIALLAETGGRLGTADLARLQVLSSGENGLIVQADSGSGLGPVTLAQSTITTAGTNGVLVLATEGGQLGAVTVEAVAIAQAGANGILALADNGGQLDALTLSQNQVTQAGENGLAVLADGGSTIGQATVTDTLIGTVASNGILVQANNGSSLTAAALGRNRVTRAGSNGLLVAAQNGSQLSQVRVDDFDLTQADANGMLIQADGGARIALTSVTDSAILEAGENGVLLQADNGSELQDVTLSGGAITAAGQNGVLVLANNGSQIRSATVDQLQVGTGTTTGTAIASNGILLFADNGSRLDNALIQSNQVGAVGATGIQVFAEGQSQLNQARVLDNQIQNTGAGGILVFADGQSQLTEVTLTANDISQTGREAMQVFADGESDITTATLTDNRISQTASTGIQVFAANQGQIDQVQVGRNQLTTIGQDGIVAFAETGGRLGAVTLTENSLNQVTQDGLRSFATNGGTVDRATMAQNQTQSLGGNGLFAFADSTSQLSTLTLTANQLQQSGDNAVELGNESANDFCALLTDNTSIGTANFDANLFVTGTGALQLVDLAQLNANNTNTFDQVNNAGATNGTRGVSPCPL